MSKPILVGYDPRALDRAPVEFGVAASRLTGAPLVIGSVERGSLLPSETDDDLVQDCSEAVADLEAELRSAGIPVECRTLRSTSAARALIEAAQELDAGLLVVGSSRRAGVGRVLLGSTAERLMHGCSCAVTAVPQGWTEPDGAPSTIGVGFVDTPEGHAALRSAHALSRRLGATLRVLTVVRETLRMHLEAEPRYVAGQFGKDLEDVDGEHLVAAERRARQAVAELDGDVTVEVDAFVGDPAEVLVDVSRHLDLLVCGSRGYGPLRAVMLGSVSRHVTAEAHCPVIVLPRGVKSSLEALLTEAPGAAAPA
jgi:nucleotide-binding universal stress UspA family protein